LNRYDTSVARCLAVDGHRARQRDRPRLAREVVAPAAARESRRHRHLRADARGVARHAGQAHDARRLHVHLHERAVLVLALRSAEEPEPALVHRHELRVRLDALGRERRLLLRELALLAPGLPRHLLLALGHQLIGVVRERLLGPHRLGHRRRRVRVHRGDLALGEQIRRVAQALERLLLAADHGPCVRQGRRRAAHRVEGCRRPALLLALDPLARVAELVAEQQHVPREVRDLPADRRLLGRRLGRREFAAQRHELGDRALQLEVDQVHRIVPRPGDLLDRGLDQRLMALEHRRDGRLDRALILADHGRGVQGVVEGALQLVDDRIERDLVAERRRQAVRLQLGAGEHVGEQPEQVIERDRRRIALPLRLDLCGEAARGRRGRDDRVANGRGVARRGALADHLEQAGHRAEGVAEAPLAGLDDVDGLVDGDGQRRRRTRRGRSLVRRERQRRCARRVHRHLRRPARNGLRDRVGLAFRGVTGAADRARWAATTQLQDVGDLVRDQRQARCGRERDALPPGRGVGVVPRQRRALVRVRAHPRQRRAEQRLERRSVRQLRRHAARGERRDDFVDRALLDEGVLAGLVRGRGGDLLAPCGLAWHRHAKRVPRACVVVPCLHPRRAAGRGRQLAAARGHPGGDLMKPALGLLLIDEAVRVGARMAHALPDRQRHLGGEPIAKTLGDRIEVTGARGRVIAVGVAEQPAGHSAPPAAAQRPAIRLRPVAPCQRRLRTNLDPRRSLTLTMIARLGDATEAVNRAQAPGS
jgi:hypothetical protein